MPLVSAVQVTVAFNSQKTVCEGQCGIDWSSAEMVGMVKKRLAERFGNTVKLALVDLSAINRRSQALKKRLAGDNLFPPVLLINNEVRIPGEFDIRQLMDAVEVEREIDETTV